MTFFLPRRGPVMPKASLVGLSPSPTGFRAVFTLSSKLRTYGDISMTRKELLSQTAREARKTLADHITLFSEPLQSQESNSLRRYELTCDICPANCTTVFLTPGRLSCASVAGLAGAFFSLCEKLEKVEATLSEGQDGQRILI